MLTIAHAAGIVINNIAAFRLVLPVVAIFPPFGLIVYSDKQKTRRQR